MSIIDVALAKYAEQLQRHPLQMKSSTAGVTMALGEAIAQLLRNGQSIPDLNRCASMAAFGMLWSGPSNHYWNLSLEKLLKNQKPGGRTLAIKVLLDQLIYGPLCNILILTWRAIVFSSPQEDLKTIIKKIKWQLKHIFPAVQLNAWKIWPFASIINFQIVPIQYRSLFMNIVGLCWTTILVLGVRENKPKNETNKPKNETELQKWSGAELDNTEHGHNGHENVQIN